MRSRALDTSAQVRHSRLGLQATCHQHERNFREVRKIDTIRSKLLPPLEQ